MAAVFDHRAQAGNVRSRAAALSEADALEVWLVLNLLEHAHPDDRVRLESQARDLVYRLRNEGKLEER